MLYFIALLGGLNEIMCIKFLEQWMGTIGVQCSHSTSMNVH